MSGLLASIPGLSAHQMTVAPAVSVFDWIKADQLRSDELSLVASFYPAGALEWLQEHRADIWQYLLESEAEIDKAVLAEDRPRFLKALDIWSKRHQKAFDIYRERPPIVERQDALFTGAN